MKTKIYEHQVVHAAAFTPYHDDICAIVTWAVTDAISPVNARLEAMEHHLDAMEHRLTARLDELEHHFTARLDELVEVSYQVGYSWFIWKIHFYVPYAILVLQLVMRNWE